MNNNSNSPEFQKALKELKIKPIPNYIGDV